MNHEKRGKREITPSGASIVRAFRVFRGYHDSEPRSGFTEVCTVDNRQSYIEMPEQ